MNKKLVFVPLAYKINYSMSANMPLSNDEGITVYLKNALVLLLSVKRNNPNVDIAVLVNFIVPHNVLKIFRDNNVQVITVPFDEYQMPADFKWSLAFYKICALKYAVNNLNYEYFLELDSDEICINPFEDLWKELDNKILMYVSNFRTGHSTRLLYSEIYNNIYRKDEEIIINKAGGGFIAGRKNNLAHFMMECDKVYKFIQKNISDISTNIGDEIYTSIYYERYPEKVGHAGAYVDVYWTGNFYYVSTNYQFDPVSIIHLPDEKQRGLLWIYRYFEKKQTLPPNKKLFTMLSFPKAHCSFSISRLWERVKTKYYNQVKF